MCTGRTSTHLTLFDPRELVDSNLAAACEILGVIHELLMNPVNFHVDDPSHFINGHSD
jgi:hypothetical protein